MTEQIPYAKLKIRSRQSAQVELTAEIPVETLETYKKAALEKLRGQMSIPGFRPGKAPDDVLVKYLPAMEVLAEAAELALSAAYPAIVAAEKLDVLGRPRVTITKIAPGNSLEFSVRVSIVPEVKLPNYKKASRNVAIVLKEPEISETELEKTIYQLRAMLAGNTASAPVESAENTATPKEPPELDDESVKKLGPFANLADFKNKLRENLQTEKKIEARKQRRQEIMQKILTGTTCILPELFIAEELAAMQEKRTEEMQRLKLTPAEYFQHINKTEAEFAAQERAFVERQLKTRLVLEAIARAENIQTNSLAVEQEVKLLARRYPNIDTERLRRYAENVLRDEKVMEILENAQ